MKKILLTLSVLLFIIIGITIVLANYINFEKNITFLDSTSKNIITSSQKLNWIIVIFKSNTDISNYKIKSICKNNFKFLWKQNKLYVFNLTLLDNNCTNPNFVLENNKEIFSKSHFKLKIENKASIFAKIIDYNNDYINKLNKVLIQKIEKYSIYNKNNKTNFKDLKNKRFYEELIYKQKIVAHILNRRNLKYISPVKWYKIPEKLNEIPNAARPYRKHYTDGIHRWWDIVTPRGTMSSALDDWIIIRIVRNFKFEDLWKIVKKGDINYTQQLRNLDILRWNQVWLKTSKWDVVFYSHLWEINKNLKEWDFISVWTNIWTIDKSWVPDKNYTNFHLHFPIQKNPYIKNKAGRYSWEDYMAWDWYLKWLDPTAVIKWQRDVFIKEAFENKK